MFLREPRSPKNNRKKTTLGNHVPCGAGIEKREVAGLIFFVLAAFHTAQELTRRQPASTAAGRKTRRGRAKDSLRRPDEEERPGRPREPGTLEPQDQGSTRHRGKTRNRGKTVVFSCHPPKPRPRLPADRRFYPHLRSDSPTFNLL